MGVKFFVLIGIVIVFTALFCILIWRQFGHFQKKAIEAKHEQAEQRKILKKQIMEKKQAERRQKQAEMEALAKAEAKAAIDLISQPNEN